MVCVQVDGRQEKKVGGSENAGDGKIDVKGPAPGCGAYREGTADDRSKNTADTPDEADAGNVGSSFVGGGFVGEVI